MSIFLSPDFVLEEVTTSDLIIASLTWGITLGIGWLTTWKAMKQTIGVYKRHGLGVFLNAYVWMIWLEILVCLAFGIVCFIYLLGIIPPSFAFYFCILTLWALQVQFLLQIIINRCALLLTSKKHAQRVKIGVAVLITAINVSVYCIWVPARLQVSELYIHINEYWDRAEKIIYLVVDAVLNVYFIRVVQHNLVEHGLAKYRNLVRFNMFIIGFSLSMDVLIISMMSLKNTFVYMQFHPLAYIVKLNIEMSMAGLIARIAKSRNPMGHSEGMLSHSRTHGTQVGDESCPPGGGEAGKGRAWATVTTTVEMHSMKKDGSVDKVKGSFDYNDTDASVDSAASYTGHLDAAHTIAPDYACRAGSASSNFDPVTVGAVSETDDRSATNLIMYKTNTQHISTL
ncbi:hypothetical protein V2A60_009626 [Cordyceps javanica]